MYEIGVGKADITVLKKGIGMMGYGMWQNTVDDIHDRIHARAFVFKDTRNNRKLCFVNAEIAFITISVKRGVYKRMKRHHAELGYELDNLFLSAQHTHSAPGGYSHFGLYNLSIPGFVPEVYQGIVDGIVEAILIADADAKPASLNMGAGLFEPNFDVASNRALKAYNLNPEVKTPITQAEAHKAVDPEMLLWRIDREGKPIASINWFGVHCTSISNDNHNISGDNKGFAATYLEEDMQDAGNPGFIAAFAQKACGDITPNYVWDKKKKWTRGKFEDDYESAKLCGKLQYQKAKEIQATANTTVTGEIDYGLTYVNFANVTCDPEFTNQVDDAQTGPSCHGVAFFAGTLEGPGMPPALKPVAAFICDFMKVFEYVKAQFISEEEKEVIYHKYKVQGKKKILFETAARKVLATKHIDRLVLPGWADPGIRTLKDHYKNGSLDHKPWTPQTLPLHIAIIGQVAMAGIPGEITVIASDRLRKTILDVLKQRRVEEVIIVSYCNAYSGYITTYEEYQAQTYEGGHTVFGEYTLAAFQTHFKKLAEELLKKPEDRDINTSVQPTEFTEDELKRRSYLGPI